MPKKKFNRKTDRANWFRTVSQKPDQIELLKNNCKVFSRWFWIIHQPDHEHGVEHMHLLVMASGSYKISTVARKLEMPENMIQPAFNYKKDARYLIHLDDPEKHQYLPTDVHTNFPGIYKSMLIDSANDDIDAIFNDLKRLYHGIIPLSEFVELHRLELQNMSFYQKIKTFEILSKNQQTAT